MVNNSDAWIQINEFLSDLNDQKDSRTLLEFIAKATNIDFTLAQQFIEQHTSKQALQFTNRNRFFEKSDVVITAHQAIMELSKLERDPLIDALVTIKQMVLCAEPAVLDKNTIVLFAENLWKWRHQLSHFSVSNKEKPISRETIVLWESFMKTCAYGLDFKKLFIVSTLFKLDEGLAWLEEYQAQLDSSAFRYYETRISALIYPPKDGISDIVKYSQRSLDVCTDGLENLIMGKEHLRRETIILLCLAEIPDLVITPLEKPDPTLELL